MDQNFTKYYKSIPIKGKNAFICKYNNCEKVELIEESIVEHIKQHLTKENNQNLDKVLAKQLNDSKETTDGSAAKSRQRSNKVHFKSINAGVNKLKNVLKCRLKGCSKTLSNKKSLIIHRSHHLVKNRVQTENVSRINEESITSEDNVQRLSFKRDFKSDPNYRGINSLKNLEPYYERKILNGIKQIVCKFSTDCNYTAAGYRSTARMARHINLRHIKIRKFKCNQINCNKVFESPVSLRQHELNHLCGFGFGIGSKINTICGNESINRFRERVINGQIKFNRCKWNGCPFVTRNRSTIKRHIHNQHLCPFRAKHINKIESIDQMIEQKPQLDQNTQELDIYKRAEPYIDKQDINNEDYFVCKWNKCQFIAKSLRDVSLHIGFKHLRVYDCGKKYIQFPQTPQMSDFEAFSLAKDSQNTKGFISKKKSRDSKRFYQQYDSQSDQSFEDKPIGVWKPFKCHYNSCSQRFFTLDIMRNHFKVHKQN